MRAQPPHRPMEASEHAPIWSGVNSGFLSMYKVISIQPEHTSLNFLLEVNKTSLFHFPFHLLTMPSSLLVTGKSNGKEDGS